MAAEQNIIGTKPPMAQPKQNALPPIAPKKQATNHTGEETIFNLGGDSEKLKKPAPVIGNPEFENKSIEELEAILDGYKKAEE